MIVGAGGHGKSVADLLLLQSEYEIFGFVDDVYPEVLNVLGYPVIGKVSADTLASLQQNVEYAVIAIGNNALRETIFNLIVGLGFNVPSIIHPKAVVSNYASIGTGCVIMANAVIGTESILGNGVILNTGAIVDHHAVVEDFGHLGVNTCMAGGSKLGRSAWMQAGSSLGYGVSIPKASTLLPGQGVA